jgi:peptidoglycan/LPS O-acetylase OafA/YrhL
VEGKAARIARYAVLAVFLCLTLGPACLVLANLPPGIVLQDAGIVAVLLFFLLFGARVAWEALRQCRGCREWSRVLLLIVSVTIPALAALHDAFQEPEDRDAMTIAPIRLALGAIATLWAVATIGAIPAEQERRRWGRNRA